MPPAASSATSSKRSRRRASPSTATNLLRSVSLLKDDTPDYCIFARSERATDAGHAESDDRLDLDAATPVRRFGRARLGGAPLRQENPDERGHDAEAAGDAEKHVRP